MNSNSLLVAWDDSILGTNRMARSLISQELVLYNVGVSQHPLNESSASSIMIQGVE